MRRLAAAFSIAALFFFFVAVPARARTEAIDAHAPGGGSSAAKSGCMVAAPGVPATLTGLGLMVVAVALGYRRRR